MKDLNNMIADIVKEYLEENYDSSAVYEILRSKIINDFDIDDKVEAIIDTKLDKLDLEDSVDDAIADYVVFELDL